MTHDEKMEALKNAISPDTDTDAVLSSVLSQAEAMVLNRMYPFGYSFDTQVPARYEQIQIQLATELYTKRGAEGQASHTENGTTRTWAAGGSCLSRIVPHVGSVVSNA